VICKDERECGRKTERNIKIRYGENPNSYKQWVIIAAKLPIIIKDDISLTLYLLRGDINENY